jgi:hypothetical protein
MKQQRLNDPKKPQTSIQIVNENGTGDGRPIRTIHYIEVGDMTRSEINVALQQVSAMYRGSSDAHYIIPVRNGNVRIDMEIEAEFLETVGRLCKVEDEAGEEIVGAKIKFRENTQEVSVIRKRV